MRKYLYADESGNFDFSNNPKASKYFILTTVLIEDHNIAIELSELRRKLAWDRVDLLMKGFHATEDKQRVRDAVFDILQKHDFRIDTTILEKRKTQPHWRESDTIFYKYAWYYHMKYVVPKLVTNQDEMLVVASSIGTNKKAAIFYDKIQEVMSQVSAIKTFRTAFWKASSDLCLQIADYCCWAIQRKWESDDNRSYQLIASKIKSEFHLYARANTS